MFPIRDDLTSKEKPIITYTLIALNIIVYFWDRMGRLDGMGILFSDLALRPAEIVAAISGRGEPLNLASLFTSLFLHGNLWHLVGNLIFLLTFGDNVEQVFGPVRYVLYYLLWGFLASAAHIWVDPNSMVPMLGASGAIGGVLGAYFLLFPGNRVQFIIFPIVWIPFTITAWILLAVWFALQILFPQEGVANWAHAGGFAAGMATVLISGGRERLLKNVKLERTLDEEFN